MAEYFAEKYLGNNELWKIYQQFPPNIIRLIRQFERINKKYVERNVYNVQSNIYIYILWLINKDILSI